MKIQHGGRTSVRRGKYKHPLHLSAHTSTHFRLKSSKSGLFQTHTAPPRDDRRHSHPMSITSTLFVSWPWAQKPSKMAKHESLCLLFYFKKNKSWTHIRADLNLYAETSHFHHPDWQQAITGYFLFIFFKIVELHYSEFM